MDTLLLAERDEVLGSPVERSGGRHDERLIDAVTGDVPPADTGEIALTSKRSAHLVALYEELAGVVLEFKKAFERPWRHANESQVAA